jgi:hypothetical protein
MARRAGRTDANHGAIIAVGRYVGATMVPTGGVGDGFPDVVVGWRGETLLVEIKDGSRVPSERKLKPSQIEWQREWKGRPVFVVLSPEDFLERVLGFANSDVAGVLERYKAKSTRRKA